MAAAKNSSKYALLKSEVEWDTKPHFPARVLGCRIYSAALYVNRHFCLRQELSLAGLGRYGAEAPYWG